MLSTLAKSALRPVTKVVRATSALSSTATKVDKYMQSDSKFQESQSFCMNIFRGQAVLDQVFPYPLKLNEDQLETLHMIVPATEKFFEEVNDAVKNDDTANIPKEVLLKFAELGGLGLTVPPEYGGSGMSSSQYARISEVIGYHDLAFSIAIGAHQSIGYKGITLFGTEEQKAKYLPDLTAGRKFAAFCLTEPSSGSDANSIRSIAHKSSDGTHYILNGSKLWISNGGFADVFTVFAQTPIKMPDGSTKDKVSAFIVERAFGGVTSGPPEKKMGIKGSNTAEVNFDNVKVPVENLLGTEGEGFKVAMNILNNGRFGLPASLCGVMKNCIKKTIDHVTQRVQFGQKLQEFFNVKEKLAIMLTRHYVTQSMLYMLAANMDRGIVDYQLEAAIAKVASSENAWHVCDEAIQLHGGMGFMKEAGLERVMRDLRIFRIFEGTNDVMRVFVALTGAQYAGKCMQKMTVDELEDKPILDINDWHASPSNHAVVAYPLQPLSNVDLEAGGSDFASLVDPALTKSAALLDNCIKEFGKTVQSVLIKYKRGLAEHQYELVRIANAAIDIYGMTAALSRCTHSCKENVPSADYEKDVTNYFCTVASHHVMENLMEAHVGHEKNVNRIDKIACTAYQSGGIPQQHPINI